MYIVVAMVEEDSPPFDNVHPEATGPFETETAAVQWLNQIGPTSYDCFVCRVCAPSANAEETDDA